MKQLRVLCVSRLLLAWLLAGVVSIAFTFKVQAQTATITALTGQSCTGTRAGRNLGCTANDFAVGLGFTQPALNAIQNCITGEYISIDVIASITSGSPERYDVGIFIGENGNDPTVNNAANMCSLGVFPTSPLPYFSADADVCGDFKGSSTATLRVNTVRLLCAPTAGSNLVNVPYVVAWDNQISGSTCTTANLTANTNSKCVASNAASVTGIVTLGYVTITKATSPAGAADSFAFAATASPAATVTPSSFNLSDGQSQRVTVPMSDTGGTRTLVIDEALTSGWEPGAVITCTHPSGGSAASYVTIDNANRRVTANLTAANYGALCTVTNTKKPTVTLRKTWVNATLNDAVTVAATGLTSLAAVANTANETDAGASQPVSIGSVLTLSETFTTGLAVNYTPSLTCTGTTGLSGSTLTVGAADTAIVCTYTNTRNVADLTMSKTDSKTTTLLGDINVYTITVSNSGLAAASGAVVVDPATTGLNCTSLSCSAAGGAACPAAPTVAAFQNPGLTIPTLPNGGSVTFTLSCAVTATGV
jgi:uncharacterized repeat protein (TIGR01451 family)